VTEALRTAPRASSTFGSDDAERPAVSPGSRAAIALLRIYQAARGTRPSPCRFVPSCSEYAVESFERHGLVRGGLFAIRRLGRCRPFGGQGADPVPD
jgi:uncharacterized protein